jgi:hypothetical protein
MWRTNRATVSAVLDEGQFEFQFLQKFALLFRHSSLPIGGKSNVFNCDALNSRSAPDAMNFNWLKCIPLHFIAWAELADSCAATYCSTSSLPPFVRNALLATHRKP